MGMERWACPVFRWGPRTNTREWIRSCRRIRILTLHIITIREKIGEVVRGNMSLPVPFLLLSTMFSLAMVCFFWSLFLFFLDLLASQIGFYPFFFFFPICFRFFFFLPIKICPLCNLLSMVDWYLRKDLYVICMFSPFLRGYNAVYCVFNHVVLSEAKSKWSLNHVKSQFKESKPFRTFQISFPFSMFLLRSLLPM